MPDHRPVVFLTFLSWLAAIALSVVAVRSLETGDYPEVVRAHMTGALAICAVALLAHGWAAIYAWGVGRELRSRAAVGRIRGLARGAFWASVVALASIGLLALPGGLGLVMPRLQALHGQGSWIVLGVLLAASLFQAARLTGLRRELLRIDRSDQSDRSDRSERGEADTSRGGS